MSNASFRARSKKVCINCHPLVHMRQKGRGITMNLTTRQRRELRELIRRKPNCPQRLGTAECFILNFVSFEANSRRICHYYRCRKASKSESRGPILIDQLEKALAFYEVTFPRENLDKLLNSKLKKRGGKSARNLRNGIFHRWCKSDCAEATKRFEEFSALFQNFEDSLLSIL